MTPPPEQSSPRRALGTLILRVAATILVFVVLFRFLPVRQVETSLRQLPVSLLIFVLLGYLSAHVVALLKWRMMVNRAGAELKVLQAVHCYFAGLFSVLLLPSIVGGDVVRAGLAWRMGRSKAAVLFGGLLDRILDFLALAALTICGAVLVPGNLTASSRRVFFVLGIAEAVLIVLACFVIVLLPARRFSFRIRRKLVRLREAQRSMAAEPRVVCVAFVLSVLVQLTFIVLTVVLANAAGLRLPFHAWLFAWPMAKFSALIPLTQGGIGVREVTLAALLLPFGAPAAQTVAIGLAWEGITISGALLGGLASSAIGRFKLDAS